MLDRCHRVLLGIPRFVGHPLAMLVLAIYSVAWFVVENGNIGWDGFGQVFSLAIVIAIQASQNRDTKALHAKIDELILSMKEADSTFAGIEKEDEKVIEQHAHSTPKDSLPK